MIERAKESYKEKERDAESWKVIEIKKEKQDLKKTIKKQKESLFRINDNMKK